MRPALRSLRSAASSVPLSSLRGPTPARLGLVLASLCLLLVVAAAPAAADGPRAGDRVVVQENETVEGGLSATAGVVRVEGTVDGDLEAYGGRVVIAESGTVTGRVRAGGGLVRIDGTVEENALAYGGRVVLGETARVGRSFGAVGGGVRIAGRVGGDATVAARTVVLGGSATVAGDLNYDGDLVDEGGAVAGERLASSDLAIVPSVPVPGPVLSAYWLVANALLGAALLLVFPRYTWAAANTAIVEPLQTGAVGLATAVLVPVLLGLVALTVVGIPLAVVGAAAFFALVWAGSVLGRYAIGTWLLSLRDVEHRWGALLLGLVVVAVLGQLPFLGALVQAVALLLGLGVVTLGLRAAYSILRDHPGGVTSL